MNIMPLYLLFLQSLPETAIVISLGLVLIGVKLRLIPVLMVALVTSIVCDLIRMLPLPPGMNVLLLIPVLITMTVWLFRIKLIPAILASFLGIICLGIAELLFNSLMFVLTGISIREALADPLWHILYPLPEYAFLIIIIFVLRHQGATVFNLSDTDELELINNEKR